MTEQKKEEVEQKKEVSKRRQIIIETDGNNVFLIKAEVSGRIELSGILNSLLNHIASQK